MRYGRSCTRTCTDFFNICSTLIFFVIRIAAPVWWFVWTRRKRATVAAAASGSRPVHRGSTRESSWPWTTPSPTGKYSHNTVYFIHARRYSKRNVSLYFQPHAVTLAWPLATYNVIPMSATFR